MVDPTGMEGEGWIEWTSKKGDKHLTYDSAINTKDEAIKKNYTNVESVFQEGTLYHNNENLDLKSDGTIVNISGGTFGGDIDDMSFRSSDNRWVSENKGIIDAFGDSLPGGLSQIRDAISTAAIPVAILPGGQPVAAVMITVGGGFSTAGTFLDLVNDGFEGKLTFTKSIQKLLFYGAGTKVKNVTGNNIPLETIVNDALTKTDQAVDKIREKK